jgi:hypothetical protein
MPRAAATSIIAMVRGCPAETSAWTSRSARTRSRARALCLSVARS